MEVKEFQQNALRTESIVPVVETNYDLLIATFKMFIEMSKILDGIKRSIYYSNDDRLDEILSNESIRSLKNQFNDLVDFMQNANSKQTVTNVDSRVLHATLGMCTEPGELSEAILDSMINGSPLDKVNIGEEMHDSSWYHAVMHDVLDLDWNEGFAKLIAKLKERFPEKFTTESAVNRDLDKERKALEG